MFSYRTDFAETLCFLCNTKARDTFLLLLAFIFKIKNQHCHTNMFFFFVFLSALFLLSCILPQSGTIVPSKLPRLSSG